MAIGELTEGRGSGFIEAFVGMLATVHFPENELTEERGCGFIKEKREQNRKQDAKRAVSTEEEPKERSGEGDQWKAESSDKGTGDRDEVESPEMGSMQFVPKILRFMPESLTKMETYGIIILSYRKIAGDIEMTWNSQNCGMIGHGIHRIWLGGWLKCDLIMMQIWICILSSMKNKC